MINVEFEKKNDKDKYIKVNGKSDLKSFLVGKSAGFYNEDVIDELCNATFLELGEHLDSVSWDIDSNEFERLNAEIVVKDTYNQYLKCPLIQFEININWEEWSKQWSISDFAEELSNYVEDINDSTIEYYEEDDDFLTNGFGLRFYINSPELVIKNQMEKYHKKFNEIIDIVNDRLILKLNKSSDVSIFKFPPEIKTACEQYLIYFTQFLKDIGIEATADLTNENNKVLFSVTPKDKTEGLERIKDALLVYLNLPSAPGIEVYQSQDIAVQQLQSNIMHLKGQLMLAKSTIQLKDATIEALQLTNYQYRSALDTMNSKKDSEEALLDGIVKVGSYKKFGVTFELGKIFKKLKRKIND